MSGDAVGTEHDSSLPSTHCSVSVAKGEHLLIEFVTLIFVERVKRSCIVAVRAHDERYLCVFGVWLKGDNMVRRR